MLPGAVRISRPCAHASRSRGSNWPCSGADISSESFDVGLEILILILIDGEISFGSIGHCRNLIDGEISTGSIGECRNDEISIGSTGDCRSIDSIGSISPTSG